MTEWVASTVMGPVSTVAPRFTLRRGVTYQKACSCFPSTASGPRIMLREVANVEGYLAIASFVEKACDECDTPWERQQ